MAKEKKQHRLDRPDGYYIKDTDTMHKFFPYLLPNRTDNEAVMSETVDLTAIKAYLEKKNADSPEFKYTFFHVICAAIAKTIALRPRMNRFYAGQRFYERKDIIISFTAKRRLVDNSDEALAMLKIDRDGDVPPIEQVYEKVKKFVYSVRRDGNMDNTTDIMATILKLPRPIVKLLMRVLRFLEYHGKYPLSLMKEDPYYSSVYVSNLGSIKMHASYHHLTNWGTNSLFVVIDEKKPMIFFDEDGRPDVREGLNLGITIDERIADGMYFANSIKILRKILENPELLELPIMTEVEL
ncbi:MAG: 2-oxo acid dehydrogenase subunit E2 [Clostridia bacterium]|nr:2-oxo acid dehydrogenase subunit E2 [Clostridia bacterium]